MKLLIDNHSDELQFQKEIFLEFFQDLNNNLNITNCSFGLIKRGYGIVIKYSDCSELSCLYDFSSQHLYYLDTNKSFYIEDQYMDSFNLQIVKIDDYSGLRQDIKLLIDYKVFLKILLKFQVDLYTRYIWTLNNFFKNRTYKNKPITEYQVVIFQLSEISMSLNQLIRIADYITKNRQNCLSNFLELLRDIPIANEVADLVRI